MSEGIKLDISPLPAEIECASRQVRRAFLRTRAKLVRPRRAREIKVQKKVAEHKTLTASQLLLGWYEGGLRDIAQAMLMTSEKAQKPTGYAVAKMAMYLITSPYHKFTRRHTRGSYRSWPRSIGREALAKLDLKKKFEEQFNA